MAIELPQGLKITSKQPVDTRILLKKSAMLTVDENMMPAKYFAICMDDGKLYLYNKSNDINSETGKFRALEANVDLSNYATKEELQALANLLDSLAGRVDALEQNPTNTPKLEDLNQEQVVVLYGGNASGWAE